MTAPRSQPASTGVRRCARRMHGTRRMRHARRTRRMHHVRRMRRMGRCQP